MAMPTYIQKTLVMKPEVTQIFDDLEAWLDHCRFNLIKFDPKDLYRSQDYKSFQREQEYLARKAKREGKNKQKENKN